MIYLVTQHYPPDHSPTAVFMADIAEALARGQDVTVFSGTSGSFAGSSRPCVIALSGAKSLPPKHSFVLRTISMTVFGLRVFGALLSRAKRDDIVVAVTAPSLWPYLAALAAHIKGAKRVLILYDLYPEVLTKTNIIAETSLAARVMRWMNRRLFLSLSAIVTIGRDMEGHIASYKGVDSGKIVFIPNWATLPIGARTVDTNNVFRPRRTGGFVVGLSGNLGYTHDPMTVFEAAKLLDGNDDIHFLFSGWGVGWEQLEQLQSEAKLKNVTLLQRVSDEALEEFLTAADAWIIPYRQNLAGVSVPSRAYNLLAVGRPIIGLSDAQSELSMTLTDNNIGWIVQPEDPKALAERILEVAASPEDAREKGRRAAEYVADSCFTKERAAHAYQALVTQLTSDSWDGFSTYGRKS